MTPEQQRCNEAYNGRTYTPTAAAAADGMARFVDFVLGWQEAANQLGPPYGPVAEDGCLGPATAASMARFLADFDAGRLDAMQVDAWAATVRAYVQALDPAGAAPTATTTAPPPGATTAQPTPPYVPTSPTPAPGVKSTMGGLLLAGLGLLLLAGKKKGKGRAD